MILSNQIADTEYHPYFNTYIKLTEGDLILNLEQDIENIAQILQNIPKEKHHYAYQPGKWTIAQLIQHCVDTERVFQYRIFSIARGEKQMLNGFDENEYANALPTEAINFKNLIEEMIALRKSTVSMLRNIPDKDLLNIGSASGNPLSSRAAGFIILGHWKHHLSILEERYLKV